MNPDVVEIISQVFTVAPEDVTPESSPDTIPAWDSLGHLQLIAALETSFGVKLNLREIQTMDTVCKIEAVLTARGVLVAT